MIKHKAKHNSVNPENSVNVSVAQLTISPNIRIAPTPRFKIILHKYVGQIRCLSAFRRGKASCIDKGDGLQNG